MNDKKVEYTPQVGANFADSRKHPKAKWGDLGPDEFLEVIRELSKKENREEEEKQ